MSIEGFNKLSIEEKCAYLYHEASHVMDIDSNMEKLTYYKSDLFYIQLSFTTDTELLNSIKAVKEPAGQVAKYQMI